MLKTFVLIATLASPSPEGFDAYVLDHDMSGADCIAALLEADASPAIELVPGQLWTLAGDVALSCEIDNA
jgi:hypothetical protein